MPQKRNISSIISENKTLFVIIAIGLFMIELQILAVAVLHSGRKSLIQVLDAKNNIIYEVDGRRLSDFDKYFFEKIFGPVEQYRVRNIIKEVPFPFRAWFVAAVGVPIGMILLFSLIVKAYVALFYGEEKKENQSDGGETGPKTRFDGILEWAGRLNIFVIGLLVFLAVFAYWVVPNMVVYIGRVGIETLTKYKWVFLSAGLMVFVIVVWIIYLRYLLAKKTIESQAEVEKQRIQLELLEYKKGHPQLEYNQQEKSPAPPAGSDENETAGPPDKQNDADHNFV
jgi:hypothetical protein